MLAREADLRCGQNRPLLPVLHADKHAVPETGAVCRALPVGEMRNTRPCKAGQIGRMFIVQIQNQAAVFVLMQQDFAFRVDIVLIVFVLI